MKNHISISIYLIEDNLRYRLDLRNEIYNLINDQRTFLDYKILDIMNYELFYKNLDNINIKDSDIFIIDIDLKTYFNGVDLGKKIRSYSKNCHIIYLTSTTDKTIDIINQKISPDAYIMKSDDLDITRVQLLDVLRMLNFKIQNNNSVLMAVSGNNHLFFDIKEILYIESMKGFRNRLKIATMDSDFFIEGKLNKLKLKLSSPPFFLEFKSLIINCNNIHSLSATDETATFKNGSQITLKTKSVYKLIMFQKGIK